MQAMPAEQLATHQLARLNALFDAILPDNQFYADKLGHLQRPLTSLEQLAEIPYTHKEELLGAGSESLAANHTWPRERYARLHQTSGTRGRPMIVLDTADDWRWWIDCWQYVLDSAGVDRSDRAVLAFSFGPFIGFWSAFDALAARGAMVVPGGGATSLARLELIRASAATCLLCTPSYAMHLAEVARENHIEVADFEVRRIIVAGEPGGSIPEMRQQIESAWNATVFDHAGATEVGPWGYADAERCGLHILESEFIAEFRSVETGEPGAEGELAELIITSLGRYGAPVIRYRTSDLVRPIWSADTPDGNRFVLLESGVLGRSDDMMIVRGVNVYPTAVEQILRSFPEVVEYRLTARRTRQLDELSIEIEDRLECVDRVARELQMRLGLRIDVQVVPLGSLPRYEGKGKRFVDLREGKREA
jgi:phenylacetate-CoA ligase